MGFEAFGAGQRGDGGRQFRQRSRVKFLHGDHFDEIGRGEAAAQAGRAGSGKHVIGPEA